MEIKKSTKADLENKKHIFLEMGFAVALAAVLFAFEWKVSTEEPSDYITISEIPMETEMIPITMMSQLPPPPPPPAPIQFMDMLEIVDELNEVDIELELIDASDESTNEDYETSIPGDWEYGDEASNEIIPFLPSEDMPVFPGNVQKWIRENIHYPLLAIENGIEGRVFVQFVVERDGSIANIKVVRSVDASLDKEAVRVISKMPKWKPGKQRGKAVRVSYTLPIVFQLNQ